MIYLKIIVQLVAIFAGVLEIYNKKVLKKDYKKENFILLALAIFYSKDSSIQIIHWLGFLLSIIILTIIIDNLFSKVKSKC